MRFLFILRARSIACKVFPFLFFLSRRRHCHTFNAAIRNVFLSACQHADVLYDGKKGPPFHDHLFALYPQVKKFSVGSKMMSRRPYSSGAAAASFVSLLLTASVGMEREKNEEEARILLLPLSPSFSGARKK